jgi:Flp pilus assembly protein TadG
MIGEFAMPLHPLRGRFLPRGVTLLLTVLLMVVFLGIIAFAVDMGCIVLARTQLQAAADSAALAAAGAMHLSKEEANAIAIEYAANNRVGTRSVQITPADIQYGLWDAGTRRFTPTESMGNAAKVTARADHTTSGEIPLFFAHLFDKGSTSVRASAIATTNPRDICFTVDLSASMHDDTDPGYTAIMDGHYPGVAALLIQKVYDDFGFGTYPGDSQNFGYPLTTSASTMMSASNSPLLDWKQPLTISYGGTNYSYSVPPPYRITTHLDGWGQRVVDDSSAVIQRKAYSWVMDVQLRGDPNHPFLPGLMPGAKPPPDSTLTASYNYWKSYLDDAVSGLNPIQLGDLSYMHFLMINDRDGKPDGSSYTPLSLHYVPMSDNDPGCPMHSEVTDGGTYSFPPREEPTHSSRRAIIAALQVIKERNQIVTDPTQHDRVCIITFDTNEGTTILHPLDDKYDQAMLDCTTMQACKNPTSSPFACTATETALIAGKNYFQSAARTTSNKIFVLLTDGQPNLKTSSDSEISNYISQHPNGNFYGTSSKRNQDAALMQTNLIQRANWYLYPVGVGMDTDVDFMNRMWRMSKGLPNDGTVCPYNGSDNPTDYEDYLKEIFRKIIFNPKLRLVQ